MGYRIFVQRLGVSLLFLCSQLIQTGTPGVTSKAYRMKSGGGSLGSTGGAVREKREREQKSGWNYSAHNWS